MLDTAQVEDAFSYREDNANILSSILNLNLQYEDNEKAIINVINKFLTNAKQRREGLEFLNLLVKNCSASVIEANALNWINYCIVKYSNDVLRELRLRVLGELIEVGHNGSDFNKIFLSDYMPKVFETCITTSFVNVYECTTALKTLTICMKYYPSWVGGQRDKIEKYLITFLDNDNDNLILNAALAFHFLQQTGTSGTNGINHKTNFTQNFNKLCRTLHSLFDGVFKNETELHLVKTSNEDVFEFHIDSSQSIEAGFCITSRRICNILKFIEIMIKNKFPTAKETKPKELLEVIRRGLSFHKCITDIKMQSLVAHHFALLLSHIQVSLLKLLKMFIIWYQTNILPFSFVISKLLIDSIELIHKCDCFKLNSLYQESAYKALQEWLAIVKSSLHSQFQSQLLTCILKDITPVISQVTLTISDTGTGKKSQKAKRKAMADRIISSGNKGNNSEPATLYAKCSEQNTTRFALRTLQKLLEFTELNIKSDLLEDLYKSLFAALTSIQFSRPIHPYTDPLCQLHLYEVLVALYHQNTLTILPPLQASLNILNRGLNSRNKLITDVCERGIRILEVMCQPVCPSLYLEAARDEYININNENFAQEVTDMEEIPEDVNTTNDSLNADYDAEIRKVSNEPFDDQDVEVHYEVKQPETDHSSVDDSLSDKNPNINFEELSSVPKDDNEHKESTDSSEHKPKVTAPSEDGNETLEEGDGDQFHYGPSCSFSPVMEKEYDDGKSNVTGDETDETNREKPADSCEDLPKNINTEDEVTNYIKSTTEKTDEMFEPEAKKYKIHVEDDDDEDDKDLGDTFVEEKATFQIHPDEPAAKRAKLIVDYKDLGNTFVEDKSISQIRPDEPITKKAKLAVDADLGGTFVEEKSTSQIHPDEPAAEKVKLVADEKHLGDTFVEEKSTSQIHPDESAAALVVDDKDLGDTFVEEKSTSQIHSNEPSAEKAKLAVEDKDLGDIFVEEKSTSQIYPDELAAKKGRLVVDDKDLGDTFAEEKSTSQIHPDEPSAKKAKLVDDDDQDLGDTFVENFEQDLDKSDSTFLEDDSFVDEVKDY